MSIITHAQTSVTSSHPRWCSPLVCDASVPSDVRHSSEPQVVEASQDDAIVMITQTCDDELDRDGRLVSRNHGVHLTVENTQSLNVDGSLIRGDVHLSVRDAEEVGLQLLAYAARARRAECGAHHREVHVPEARKAHEVAGMGRHTTEFVAGNRG